MKLKLSDIVRITGGTWIQRVEGDPVIESISTDTRILQQGELFVALKGKQFDGNLFYAEALQKRAAGVLLSRDDQLSEKVEGNIIIVADTVEALHRLSHFNRVSVQARAIGITGSTGKTIVKDMLSTILASEFNVLATPLSFHGQIGLPLTLLNVKDNHNLLILELGISRVGEMEKLSGLAKLDMALITNISETHLEYLETIETVAREKAKIFSGFSSKNTAILNGDDPYCRAMMSDVTFPCITFGLENNVDFHASAIEPTGRRGYWLTIEHGDEKERMYLNAFGKHNIYNALAAIAAARESGASWSAIRTGLGKFTLPQMRLEIHITSVLEENVTIINDTYNASPASMKGALDALVEMSGQKRKIAILGDMLELGNFSMTAHEMIGAEVSRHGIDRLFTIGNLARTIGTTACDLGMSQNVVTHCQDYLEAAELLRQEIREDDYLLFKGSRLMQLDRLAAQFIGGIRPTKLTIDLEALASNVREIKEKVGPAVKIMAVVKSAGYGHDSRRVAQVVTENGADYLAVAVPDEGIFLRRAGFQHTPILVMGPTLPEEVLKLVKYSLAQAVSSVELVAEINREAMKANRTIPIHVKVDTGMGRIGLAPERVPGFMKKIAHFPNIWVEGIMTHLSSADDPDAKSFTQMQIETFKKTIADCELEGFAFPLKHAAASAGILHFPEAYFSMVRPGILLYGMYPDTSGKDILPLKPVAHFMTKIAHLKKVDKGIPISYSRTFYTSRDSIIATIPVGYYDGYNRLLSNKASVLVHGRRAPIVGNVTMDMTMLDVTDIPDVQIGDDVVLFGRQDDQEITIDELATLCNTIHYELIGNISARVSRVYREG